MAVPFRIVRAVDGQTTTYRGAGALRAKLLRLHPTTKVGRTTIDAGPLVLRTTSRITAPPLCGGTAKRRPDAHHEPAVGGAQELAVTAGRRARLGSHDVRHLDVHHVAVGVMHHTVAEERPVGLAPLTGTIRDPGHLPIERGHRRVQIVDLEG